MDKTVFDTFKRYARGGLTFEQAKDKIESLFRCTLPEHILTIARIEVEHEQRRIKGNSQITQIVV